jgi:hypothetical protein
MQSILKKMPGMENMMPGMEKMMSGLMDKKEKKNEKVIMDENFSTALVEAPEIKDDKTKFVIGDALKAANNLGVLGGKNTPGMPPMPGFGDIMNMMKGGGMNKMMEQMMKNQGKQKGSGDMNKMMEDMMNNTEMNKMMEDMMNNTEMNKMMENMMGNMMKQK